MKMDFKKLKKAELVEKVEELTTKMDQLKLQIQEEKLFGNLAKRYLEIDYCVDGYPKSKFHQVCPHCGSQDPAKNCKFNEE